MTYNVNKAQVSSVKMPQIRESLEHCRFYFLLGRETYPIVGNSAKQTRSPFEPSYKYDWLENYLLSTTRHLRLLC